jgi:hypothetical protein
MSLELPVRTTVVAPSLDAIGYYYAQFGLAGVRVELFQPRTRQEREAAIAEHVADVLFTEEEQTEADEDLIDFMALVAREAAVGAFEDPAELAVLVRIQTIAGDEGEARAQLLAQGAMRYRPLAN